MPPRSRPQWDLGRFLETTVYFDVAPLAPVIRTVQQLQQWIQGQPSMTTAATPVVKLTESQQPMTQTIVIGGNYTILMVAMIQQLQAQAYSPQAVVTDRQEGLASLGSEVEVIPLTDLKARFSEFNTLVLCLTESTPAVDLSGSEFPTLIQLADYHWSSQPERMIFDFRSASPELKQIWGSLDDVVMGGVSVSQLQVINQTAFFAGTVSTANSGGFASIRTRNFEMPLDLSAAAGLELRLRGDGKRYKFFLRTETGWDSVAYASSFDTEINTWQTLKLPFAEMMPVFRARTLSDAPPLDPRQIRSMQLMLSKFEVDLSLNPKFSPGPFALQLDWIGAYSHPPKPQVLVISSTSAPNLKSLLEQSQLRYKWIQIPRVAESGRPVEIVETVPNLKGPDEIVTIHEVVPLCIQQLQSFAGSREVTILPLY